MLGLIQQSSICPEEDYTEKGRTEQAVACSRRSQDFCKYSKELGL